MNQSKNSSEVKNRNLLNDAEWLSSTETMKALKISACELMHRREHGEFDFKKIGNAYFYKIKP